MGIVLASGSPRRNRLLRRIVRKFLVREANIAERMLPGEQFAHAAARLAAAKAEAVAKRQKNAVVIGADTIAYLGKKVFRKTASRTAAGKILPMLRGKTHAVVTGVAVLFPNGKSAKYSVRATVKMKEFSEKELEIYLKSGEWKGRAGCYDISGNGRRLVQSVKGERETVIGLPLLRLRKLLLRR